MFGLYLFTKENCILLSLIHKTGIRTVYVCLCVCECVCVWSKFNKDCLLIIFLFYKLIYLQFDLSNISTHIELLYD